MLRWAAVFPGRRWLSLALLLSLALGCSYWEERELEKERRQLVAEEALLQQQYQQATAGRTQFTAQERARIGPLYIRLRQVQQRLVDIDREINELDWP
jgi:hypothetical protein